MSPTSSYFLFGSSWSAGAWTYSHRGDNCFMVDIHALGPFWAKHQQEHKEVVSDHLCLSASHDVVLPLEATGVCRLEMETSPCKS